MANWFKQSLRLLAHELKRGELTIIFLAIVLAVSSVYILSGFSAYIQRALISESSAFIAADRVLQSAHPVETPLLDKAQDYQLATARQILFSSMVFAGDDMLLASVKAVSKGYPLRGELRVATQASGEAGMLASAPPFGSVWVDEKLLNRLQLTLGDKLELGVASFTIAGKLLQVPDQSFSVFTQGPVMIINMEDVGQTNIIQPGSRLTYRYLFAGDNYAVSDFEQWLMPRLTDNQRWYDIQTGQSPLAGALNRAEKYLSLASMLGIVLAAIAVAVASMRYSQRHQPKVAIFKAIGASQAYVVKLYLLHWSALSFLSIACGVVLGYLLLTIGKYFATDMFPLLSRQQVLGSDWYPLLIAILTGLVCGVAFAISPLKALLATQPLAVIRGFKPLQQKFSLALLVPLLALFLLILIFSGDLKLTLSVYLAAVVVAAVILLLGRLFIASGRSLGSRAGQALHLAMANLKRRAAQNSIQLVSFTLAINLLLLIVVIRTDLIDEWQAQLPVNAPNRFLVNISEGQVAGVESFIAEQHIIASALYPVVRGRLVAINSEKIAKEVSKDNVNSSDQGRRGVGRELNLTWQQKLPQQNRIIAGRWWTAETSKEVSVESQLAQRLGIGLDDRLSFQLGAQQFEVRVASIREVNWQSMQPNFYMIFSPDVLADFPATYISSLYLPAGLKLEFADFIQQYQTISVIDVDAMINQLRTVVTKVTLAVEFILLIVVAAGTLVLVAQVQASMEERERELAILRTLGAKGSLLRNSVLLEFIALGAIAGLLASVSMEFAVFMVQTQVFEMQPGWHFSYWLAGIACGSVFVGCAGFLSCARLLKLSSVTLIRRTL
jgi:putative ABC transport system permease protein